MLIDPATNVSTDKPIFSSLPGHGTLGNCSGPVPQGQRCVTGCEPGYVLSSDSSSYTCVDDEKLVLSVCCKTRAPQFSAKGIPYNYSVPCLTQDPANAPACLPTCAVFDCLANVGYDREESVTGETICGLNGCLETCCHKSMWSR
jgi:hypothetical protein